MLIIIEAINVRLIAAAMSSDTFSLTLELAGVDHGILINI